VRAVREDPKKKGLLYAGTERGVYVSFDDGAHWRSLQINLPITPIHDLVIKNDDLVVATARCARFGSLMMSLRCASSPIQLLGKTCISTSPRRRIACTPETRRRRWSLQEKSAKRRGHLLLRQEGAEAGNEN